MYDYDQRVKDARYEMLRYQFGIIRESVSAYEVGQALGLTFDHAGRCQCPFHNGKDRNMKAYKGNRGFYCFVCHAGGDCISLAKKLLGGECTYTDAAKWIDRTFNLSVFEKKIPSIRERMRRASMHTVRAEEVQR